MKRVLSVLCFGLLAGCQSPSLTGLFDFGGNAGVSPAADLPEPDPVGAATLDPTPPPPPPASATTAAEFDTTTAADREEALAAAPAPSSETDLGITLATLGAPAEPGIWVKTGLVSELAPGRVEYQGRSINVELRPSGGAAGSGSQISLPAMQLLNAPLTSIIEIRVFSLPR